MSLGATVDLWCAWTLGAQQCHLFKEGISVPWRTQMFETPVNTAMFSIPSVTEHDAGRYHCSYTKSAGKSEPSEPLELVVTGGYSDAMAMAGANPRCGQSPGNPWSSWSQVKEAQPFLS
ncbi:leukocyte immunoglobulin-like receptor subfamily A member 5 [Octodon degus]|uniref:Leukocyte immunoglobulin-like receptor subfamily A member 5 n=1 Tax=Octodon degus TaxID=10160 RepID=A0A6P6DX93_OCTDE|nr:leukocyte immunoglobulin-like receptor subfamily A member 5 [Octodon degus]